MPRLPSLAALALALASSPVFAEAVPFAERLAVAMQAQVAAAVGAPLADVEVLSTGFMGEGCGDSVLITGRPGEDYLGAVELRIEARDGTQPCGQWRVRARLARWVSLPVAQTAVAAGEPISLTVARVRLEASPGTPVLPAEGPYLARTPLRAGNPVVVENSRRLPDLAAGAPVKVLVRAGSLTIASDGHLTQPAQVGEVVTVRSTATLTLLQGTLIAHDRVLVE